MRGSEGQDGYHRVRLREAGWDGLVLFKYRHGEVVSKQTAPMTSYIRMATARRGHELQLEQHGRATASQPPKQELRRLLSQLRVPQAAFPVASVAGSADRLIPDEHRQIRDFLLCLAWRRERHSGRAQGAMALADAWVHGTRNCDRGSHEKEQICTH